jgi:amino-acid N-acetyltransferase
MKSPPVKLRKARMGDVRSIHALLNHFADRRELLPRSLAEIYENLQQFVVAEAQGKVVGTAALYVAWDNLAEVKALAVEEKYQGRGLGRRLLEACLKVAQQLEVRRVFTLTLRTGFFEKHGFKHASKADLPHKVWTECVKCVFFPGRCVEYAMVKDLPGRGPKPPRIATRRRSSAPSEDLPPGVLVPSEPRP